MGATGAWGLGLSGSAAGTLSSPLECGSCHDPHGNGNYRLLQTVPGGVSNAAVNIASASVVGATNVAKPFTTATEHYLGVGNTVTIAGVGAPFDGTWSVLSTAAYTSFTVTLTGTNVDATVTAKGTAKNAGQAVLDAPSATARVYTTTDYWKVNDETTPGITVGTNTNVKAFIGSIAAWCTQCHTRYQTGRSGTYENATGDTTFTYRHRGNSVKNTNVTNGTAYANQVNSPNCIQCHVAHGSNATAVSSSLGVNFPGTTTTEDSALLRISNRGAPDVPQQVGTAQRPGGSGATSSRRNPCGPQAARRHRVSARSTTLPRTLARALRAAVLVLAGTGAAVAVSTGRRADTVHGPYGGSRPRSAPPATVPTRRRSRCCCRPRPRPR